jgi:hypothetical protein
MDAEIAAVKRNSRSEGAAGQAGHDVRVAQARIGLL